MRLRRILLALVILCSAALYLSEFVGYTTLHQTAIDLRFWRRWTGGQETPDPQRLPQQPRDLGEIEEDISVRDHQDGGVAPGLEDQSAGDSGLDLDAGDSGDLRTEMPTPSSRCSCEYEARTLELRTPYMQGDDVESLQNALRVLGYYHGPVNGIYTPETAEAIRQLQKSQALTVDGIVGKKTVDAIGALIYTDSPNESEMDVAEYAATPVGPSSTPVNPIIVVDLDARRLTVYSEGKPFKSYPVAIGKPSTPTPTGNWKITDKGMWGGGFALMDGLTYLGAGMGSMAPIGRVYWDSRQRLYQDVQSACRGVTGGLVGALQSRSSVADLETWVGRPSLAADRQGLLLRRCMPAQRLRGITQEALTAYLDIKLSRH